MLRNEVRVNHLSILHKEVPLLVKLTLLFKESISSNEIFYIIVILLKLYGGLIFSARIKDLVHIYRALTLFEFYMRNVSYNVYMIISIVLIVAIIAYTIYIICICIYDKQNNNLHNKHNVSIISKIYCYIIMLFSQHLIEHFSIIFLITYNPSSNNWNEEYVKIDKFRSYFYNDFLKKHNTIVLYTFCVLHCICIIIVYFSSYITFFIMNSPCLTTKSKMKFRHLSLLVFGIFSQVFMLFHYTDIYLNGNIYTLFDIIMYIIFFVSLVVSIFLNIKSFEYRTNIYIIYQWVLLFLFSSFIIEALLFNWSNEVDYAIICYILVLKIFFTCLLYLLIALLRKRIMKNMCSKALYVIYEENSSFNGIYVESYFYLLEAMKAAEEKHTDLYELLSIVMLHEDNCKSEVCKCKIINTIPGDIKKNKKVLSTLSHNISFLLETALIKIKLLKHSSKLILLLSEFYYIYKHNFFMAYSLLYSYISSNWNNISYGDLLSMYSLMFSYLDNVFESGLSSQYVYFSDIINDENSSSYIDNILIDYCRCNIDIVNIKDLIESSLHIDYFYENSKEIRALSSKTINSHTINKIISLYRTQSKLYKTISNITPKCSNTTKEYIYYYKMFIFYKLFDEAIPQKVLREFYVLNHKKDFNIDEMINQYLVASNDNRIHHIILKCKKGIDIQYFSIELSNILGYSHSILINESLDYIFPAVFKGYHKKAMINYLTTHSNFMFEKNNTFIFDSNYYSIPCNIKAAVFPHMSKNINIICEINLIQKPNDLFTIITNNDDIISISKTMNDNLSLSFDVMKKYNINLFEIFDISNEINKYFSSYVESAISYTKSINNSVDEIFSKHLYEKVSNEEYHSGSSNNVNLESIAEAMLSTAKKPEMKKVIEKRRNTVLQNLVKIFNQISEIELKDDLRMKFAKIYNKFKQNTFSSTDNRTMEELLYRITFKGNSLYTFPYFIIDLELSSRANNSLFQSSKTLISRMKSKLVYKYTHTSKKEITSSQFCSSESDLSQVILESKLFIKSNVNINSDMSLSIEKEKKKQTNEKTALKPKRTKRSHNIENVTLSFIQNYLSRYLLIVSLLVIFVILLSAYMLNKQITSFQVINKLIECMYSNLIQGDSLYAMMSSFYTIISRYSDMTISYYDIEVYYSKAKNSTTTFEYYFSMFYNSYVKYNLNTGNYTEITQLVNYTKISGDFNPIMYQSDFVSEVYYIYYSSFKFLSEEKNIELIMSDLLTIIDSNFNKTPNTPVYTPFGIIMYYIMMNEDNIDSNVIEQIKNRMVIDLNDILTKLKESIYICEGILLFAYLAILVISWYFIKKCNKLMFNMIVSILHTSKSNENLLSNHIMVNFKELIQNFTLTNYYKFRNTDKVIPVVTKETKTPVGVVPTEQSSNNTNTISSTIQTNQTNKLLLSSKVSSLHSNTASLMQKLTRNNLSPNLFPKLTSTATKVSSSVNQVQPILLFSLKVILIILFFIFASCIVLFSVRLAVSIQYVNKMKLIRIVFISFSERFSNIITIYNQIRKYLIINKSGFKELEKWSIWSESDSQMLILNEKLSEFPKTNLIFQHTLKKISDPTIDIGLLCSNNTFCMEVIQQGSYLTDGIELGIKTILKKYSQIITELSATPANEMSFIFARNYCRDNLLSPLELDVEFVIQQVQFTLYSSFHSDYIEMKRKIENIMKGLSIISLIAIFCCIVIIVLVLYCKIKETSNVIYFGTTKIKQFYYNLITYK